MPSGAKKRKAAKKKKEIQSNDHINPPLDSIVETDLNMIGEDDPKNQSPEDKDSDVGEVSSSASQDHNSGHQKIISEAEGEGIEEKESKINEGIGDRQGDEQSLIQVEREFKTEDESNAKNGAFKHDDESHNIEIHDSDSMTQKPIEAVQIAPIQETGDVNVEQNSLLVSETKQPLVEKVAVEAERSMAPQSSVEDEVDGSMAYTREADNGNLQSVEQNAKNSDPKECVASDETLIVSYDATKASDNKIVLSEQDSAVTQRTHTSLSHPLQATSWKSCCGLFELFAGTSR